jgi:2-methylisocitrate lyase-like PEP mutase family enzyme
MKIALSQRAERLRALHQPGRPLVLANAWDAASARRFAGLGLPALATTSAGVANALGFADGEAIPPAEMFAALGRIAAAVAVPVTADLEAGYRLPAAELVEQLLAAGCVGLNLEDTDHVAGEGKLVDAERQAERLAAVKAAGRAAGVDVVLNARVDVYLGRVAPAARVEEGIRRGRLYLEAGADCVYPILANDEAEIAALVRGVGGPLNVMALPNGPPLARLAELGVARVSFGSLLLKRALAEAERALRSFLSPGT